MRLNYCMWLLHNPTWLEDLVLKFCYNSRHEGGVSVGEKGNRGNQRPTVVVYHILQHKNRVNREVLLRKKDNRGHLRPTLVFYLEHKVVLTERHCYGKK
jgi:hypothetical protein